MKKYPLPEHFRTYIPYIILVLFLALLMPRTARFDYDYRKGSPWKYGALVAEFDFPIYKTDAQMKEELANSSQSVIPYFRYSEDIASACLKAADVCLQSRDNHVRSVVMSSLRGIYQHGLMSDENIRTDKKLGELSEELLFVQKDKRATKYPVSEVYKVSDARQKIRKDIESKCPEADADAILRATDLFSVLEPNLIYDRQTTEMVHAGSGAYVSPTQGFVSSGTLIVSEDELVTAEIAQMLDSYKREYDANMGSEAPRFLVSLGNFVVALIVVLILLLSIFFANPKVFERKGEHLYLLFIFFISAIPAMVIARTETPQFILMMPMTLIALYLQTFFRNRMIISVYIVSLIPVLLFVPQGSEFFVMFLLSGLLAIAMFQTFNKGLMQFVTASAVFVCMTLCYLCFRATGFVSGVLGRDIWFIFVGSVLSVMAYPLIYLFEKVFGLLSISKLDELADTNNKLLRELEVKAPGTFQHSLQVMSMADSVCRVVNANAHLVRAGALYHDIGKMNNPQCFIENESLLVKDEEAKYHSGISPQQSASDIIRHVTDGIEIAERHHLPDAVKDFIITHHGNGRVGFFYNKFINEGGDPSMEPAFCYPGRKPVSKEQVILMLCDSIEAASRTLKEYTQESYSSFVDNIFQLKIDSGQLADSEISIRELGKIRDCLKSYLAQMYHERVVYPEQKEQTKTKEN